MNRPLNFPAKLRVSGESSGPPCLGFTAQNVHGSKWSGLQMVNDPKKILGEIGEGIRVAASGLTPDGGVLNKPFASYL